jgi:hypothetical protein
VPSRTVPGAGHASLAEELVIAGGNRRSSFSRYSLLDTRTPFYSRVRARPRVIRRSVALSHTPEQTFTRTPPTPAPEPTKYWRQSERGWGDWHR